MTRIHAAFVVYGGACLVFLGGVAQRSCSDGNSYSRLRARLSPRLAVGELNGLPAPIRRAYTATRQFRRLDSAEEGRWIHEDGETGQTVAEFLISGSPRPTPGRRTLVLRPLAQARGERSPDLEVLRSYAAIFFQLPVTVRPGPDPLNPAIAARRHPLSGLRQLHAPDVLKVLRRGLKSSTFAAVGITATDLFPDDEFSHVFGLASLRHRVGVFSFARFAPRLPTHRWTERRRQGLKWRSLNVLTHEAGHVFGLRHCVYYQCNMNGSVTLSENDRSPLRLCPVCLRKLQLAIGFDLQARYEGLRKFYRKHGLWRNERWVGRRLAYIRGHLSYGRARRKRRLPAGGAPRAQLR